MKPFEGQVWRRPDGSRWRVKEAESIGSGKRAVVRLIRLDGSGWMDVSSRVLEDWTLIDPVGDARQ